VKHKCNQFSICKIIWKKYISIKSKICILFIRCYDTSRPI